MGISGAIPVQTCGRSGCDRCARFRRQSPGRGGFL